jgi:hypothetical protein
MPEIKPGPLGWHTSALTNELQEVRIYKSIKESQSVIIALGTLKYK